MSVCLLPFARCQLQADRAEGRVCNCCCCWWRMKGKRQTNATKNQRGAISELSCLCNEIQWSPFQAFFSKTLTCVETRAYDRKTDRRERLLKQQQHQQQLLLESSKAIGRPGKRKLEWHCCRPAASKRASSSPGRPQINKAALLCESTRCSRPQWQQVASKAKMRLCVKAAWLAGWLTRERTFAWPTFVATFFFAPF